jgi:ABC-2 type transport system permease protein
MIRLIARREIVVRSRDRATTLSTAVTIVLLAAIILLPALFEGSNKLTVATAGGADVVRAAERFEKPLELDVVLLQVADDEAARLAVEDGRADAAVLGAGLVVSGSAPSGAEPVLQDASRSVRATAPDPPPLPVETVDADAEERQGFAAIVLIILYAQLVGYGYWVAAGVVEEKASRIVEILLATIRPRELLFGKVIGIGVVGLSQLFVIVVAGLAMGALSGEVDIGAEQIGTLPTVLAWFVLGYALYAGAFALAGSLVSRQEDVQSTTTPLILALVTSFFLSFQAVEDPSSTVAEVLSFIPISAPLVMPVRMIAGDVGALEVLLSVAIVVATTYAVIAFAARVYGTAVLQTRGRVKLRALTSGQRDVP